MWKTCINKEHVFKNASTMHTVCDCGDMHHVHLCSQTSETDLHFLDAIMKGLEVVAQCLMYTQYQ